MGFTKFDIWNVAFFNILHGSSHGIAAPEAPQSAETLGAVKSSLLQRSSATAGGGGHGSI